MKQQTLEDYQATVHECPADGCVYEGPSERSVSTHWAHKHNGPCPLTNDKKECVGCGDSFWASKAMQRHRPVDYCSRECFESSTCVDHTGTCEECGEEYEASDGHDLSNRKYCSKECANRGLRGGRDLIRSECPECEEVFKTVPSVDQTFCSQSCAFSHRDNGKTSLNERYRDAEVARGWRKGVFQRDDYTCQLCDERGGNLHAHHLVPVSEILEGVETLEEAKEHELFAEISNGVAVCETCHREHYHNDGGKYLREAESER